MSYKYLLFNALYLSNKIIYFTLGGCWNLSDFDTVPAYNGLGIQTVPKNKLHLKIIIDYYLK